MSLTSGITGRTLRLSLLLLACASATALLTAASVRDDESTVASLTAERAGASRRTVWLVFRAPDCGVSAELIAHLNGLDASDAISVVGVMLYPPNDDAAQRALSKALGIEFVVEYDVKGEWRAALQTQQQIDPVLLIRDGVAVLGTISPQFLRDFHSLALSKVPMERER